MGVVVENVHAEVSGVRKDLRMGCEHRMEEDADVMSVRNGRFDAIDDGRRAAPAEKSDLRALTLMMQHMRWTKVKLEKTANSR
jgi:hypothetical protein